MIMTTLKKTSIKSVAGHGHLRVNNGVLGVVHNKKAFWDTKCVSCQIRALNVPEWPGAFSGELVANTILRRRFKPKRSLKIHITDNNNECCL